ncbi:MAG: ChaN family lipoprotein, partial [Pseudomonadota bacterium]
GALLLAPPVASQEVSVEALIDIAGDHDVVIVGEVHGSPKHHEIQADLARALKPVALVFEMLGPTEAQTANRMRADGASADEIAAALEWEASGWPDFALYHQIMVVAPSARMFGADGGRDHLRAAVSSTAAEVFGDGAARFGLTTPLPTEQQTAREAGQAEAHCNALPESMLPGMVEAQRLRDAWLAEAVLIAQDTVGPGLVLVITGNGHARRDWGVPAVLAVAAPDLRVHTHGQFATAPATGAPFDSYTLAPVPEQGDPCAAFRAG